MYSKKYWKLISRYLSNECSAEELEKIDNLKKNDEEFSSFFNEIMNILAFKEKEPQGKSEDKKWEEIKADILDSSSGKIYKIADYQQKGQIKKHLYSRIIRYAAVFLLVTVLPYLLYNNYNTVENQQVSKNYRIVKVAHSERLAITLSDGTKITLDAGSELKIPNDYDKERVVYLEGEAFFQVAHDKAHPFRVFADNALVQVLGTEFNVRAWDEVPVVTVTVKRGKVSLSSNQIKSSPNVFLTKGKQSSIPKDGIPSIPVQVDVNNYTSWMNNELHFKDATLKEILSQLERWYNYHFEVDDTLLFENHLTYHVKKSNIDNLLQSISIITKTVIVKDGKTIKLISKEKDN